MDMREFFTLLYAEEGYKFVVVNAKKHIAATSIDHMVELVQTHDKGSNDVFHACASYIKPEYVGADGKTHWREQENVLSAKAFWLDMDCGQKWKNGKPKVDRDGNPVMGDYASQSEALAALKVFCAATKLPIPMLISSGYGIHAYWLLTEALPADKWLKIANLYRKVLQQQNMPFDPARDKDAASILRPVGSHNRKNPSDPKEVRCLRQMAAPITPLAFVNALAAVCKPDEAPKGKQRAKLKANAAFMGDADFPDVPLDANLIADKCAQVGHFRETGSMGYKNWWGAGGIMKFCVDGEKLYHEWSAKAPDYDRREAQFKYDEWEMKPTLCESFANYAKMCDSCPSKGKIRSPIRLGYVVPDEPTVIKHEPDDTDEGEKAEDESNELVITKPYTVSGGQQLTFMRRDEDGDVTPIAFCDVVFAPIARFPDQDGTAVVQFRARIRRIAGNRWHWKTFNVPASIAGSRGNDIIKALAAYEVYALPGMRKYLEDYVAASVDDLRRRVAEVNARRSMGWQSDGSFVIGKRCITPEGDEPLVLSGANISNMASAFPQPTGRLEDWSSAISGLYNREGHEQFQYVMYMGLGSMLMELWGGEVGSNFVNLYGKMSAGKTTAIKAALSAYGDSEKLLLSFKTGATTNAIYAYLSALNSVPLGVDEVTNIDPRELSDFAYALSTGKTKRRNNQKGELVTQGSDWKGTTLGSSNAPLTPRLASHKDDASAEMSRIIEINWRKDLDICTPSEARAYIAAVNANSGLAAPAIARYVIDHKEETHKLLEKVRQKLDVDSGLPSDYRFWSAQHSAGVAMGIIATKLGILDFSTAKVYKFVLELIESNRKSLEHLVTPPDASFSAMINALSNQIIVTKDEKDGRSSTVDAVVINGEPVGRLIRDKSELYIATSAIREWCGKRQVDYSSMKHSLKDKHILLDSGMLYSFGKGTNKPTAPARCWKIDVNALQGDLVEKVVHLNVVNS